ncbi:PST family polysaccharide transporter [Rhizobium sp. BK529]|uniref:lipopolysaccharide biosynthesis protein n=1 Tax=unclassified Rhizobium TaxID=2613769 RepID=UPI00104EC07E|nr:MULTISPECIES: lipopolysaccharide biosynthesis protein [unclassified Rhizobium]MBB3595712.1 PST family polysaccharide transporter [Rhizobium sp. BK529]TCR98265.1 PST family polysaccharide transporter [Rhizobium sp. BK418]
MSEPLPKSETGSVGGKTLLASIWLLTGVFYSRVANLAMIIILARILVPADFGLVALGTTLLTILTTVTDLSLANALIHHKDANKEDFDTAFTLSAIRGLALSAVMIGSGFVMAHIYNDSRLIGVCLGLSSRPLLNGLKSPHFIRYSKDLDFKTVAFSEAMEYTAQLVVSVALALATNSYWAIVAGAVAASCSGIVVSYIYAPYRPSISFGSWRKILDFSIWLTFNQFVSVIGSRFDNFLAGGLLGISAFGAYNVGNNISAMITQSAAQPLERVLFPSFAKMTHDNARLKQAYQKSQASFFAIGMPLGVGLALVAEPFVYLMLGPNWSIAAKVIQFIAPVLGIQIVFGPANALAYAVGATRNLFNRGIVLLVLRVPIVFIGLYFFGMTGLLIARVVSGGVLVSVVNFYLVRSLTGLRIWDQLFVTWRSWVSGVAMVLSVLVTGAALPPVDSSHTATLALFVMSVVGAAVYCSSHALLWVLAGRPSLAVEAEIAGVIKKFLGRRSLVMSNNRSGNVG